jgi:hypothetical protein
MRHVTLRARDRLQQHFASSAPPVAGSAPPVAGSRGRHSRRHRCLCGVHGDRRHADVYRPLAADLASGKDYLGLIAGLHDVATRWIVTHDITPWRDEIAWMSLYFSTAVWGSQALANCLSQIKRAAQAFLSVYARLVGFDREQFEQLKDALRDLKKENAD